jgi:4-hydroxy-tetrahydrodipicolinate synthase
MTAKFIGTGVALVTPFRENLSVDFQGLQKLLTHITNSKVGYLVVHGTTGEASTTTPEEKREILSFIHTHNPKNLPIICGIGGNNTREVINIIENTDFQGIDAILSASPYYNKPSQEGIYQHYIALAEACPVPILLYNIPARTGTNMTAETTLQLSKHPNIAKGIHDGFLIISGEDMLTLPMIAAGAVGVISAIANGFPKTMTHMVDLSLQGNDATARSYTWSLLPLDKLLGRAGNPVGTKQMLAALGICENYVRLPLVTTSAPLAQEIQAAVFQEGVQ